MELKFTNWLQGYPVRFFEHWKHFFDIEMSRSSEFCIGIA